VSALLYINHVWWISDADMLHGLIYVRLLADE
jgi:hypothetical protein